MSSWLLRLFESQFFDSRLAIYYLHQYPEKVGVQHYICKKLDEFPIDEIIFLLPQLCHLLISKPNQSPALEEFILRKCRSSDHMEVLTIWMFTSYINDLKTRKIKRNLVRYCEKVYAKLRKQAMNEFSEDNDILVNPNPAIVGVGCTLASLAVPGLPGAMREVIALEGKRPKETPFPSLEKLSPTRAQFEPSAGSFMKTPITSVSKVSIASLFDVRVHLPRSAPSAEQLSQGNAFSSASYIHSQLSLMMALVELGDRLLSVPKEARQSSLLAEIGLINQNLPADICIPLYCSSDDHHHKILRISPIDSVVLNSADRVPYLIYIEVITGEYSLDELRGTRSRNPSGVSRRSSHTHGILSQSRSSIDLSIQIPQNAMAIESRTSKRLGTPPGPASETPETTTPPDVSDQYNSFLTSPSPVDRENRVFRRRLTVGSISSADPNFLSDTSEKLKTAAILLAQLYQEQRKALTSNTNISAKQQKQVSNSFDVIRNKIVKEMMQLEEQRLEFVKSFSKDQVDLLEMREEILDPEQEKVLRDLAMMRKSDDPSAVVFKESWQSKKERIQKTSSFGKMDGWDLISVIVKSGADLRQEELALQLIAEMHRIWEEAVIDVRVYRYRVLITSHQSGLIETIKNAISIHSIKKDGYARNLNQKGFAYTLYDHFVHTYGLPSTSQFMQAQDNFMRSLVAYSVISYVLQIKDRHNGNILIDLDGHIIHIDFGFMLSNSPGSFGFELSPFKMPQEYIDILGGQGSEKFEEFRALMRESFLALRRKVDHIVGLVEMMEKDSTLSCFTGVTPKPNAVPTTSNTGGILNRSYSLDTVSTPKSSSMRHELQYPVSASLRERFHMNMTESQISEMIDKLIDSSCNNMFTRLYDSFQYYSQGIF